MLQEVAWSAFIYPIWPLLTLYVEIHLYLHFRPYPETS